MTSNMFNGSQKSAPNQTYQFMSSGLSVMGSQAQTQMMNAINHQKTVKDNEVQIRARIVKLKKEEERAHKRINDLDRRNKFVNNMHEIKNEKINMINIK